MTFTTRKARREAAKGKPSKATAKPTHRIKTSRLRWNDVLLKATYERNCAGEKGRRLAHVQVWVQKPKGAILPTTHTGYCSIFIETMYITAAGGLTRFVRSWLNTAAEHPAWRERELASRQLSLF